MIDKHINIWYNEGYRGLVSQLCGARYDYEN